jgi:uncharacterized damage-inducible protein DinB
MKTYFIKLFDYDRYANLLIIETIKKTSNPDQAVRLMAHMLAAQQVWLGRCKNESATNYILWPDWKADALEPMINENHQRLINFLEYLSPDDFENNISYRNSKGDGFENKLSDILAHVINHGTHHRAQAGQHLKLAGADLPVTDYIFYLRS